MTTAKLVTNPGEGHGLTDKLCSELYGAMTHGKPTRPVLALVLLEPVGLGQRKTAKGRHQHVVFEATMVELPGEADAARLIVELNKLHEVRTERSGQRQLSYDWPGMPEEEKRRHAIEQIEDWAEGNGYDVPVDLAAMWRDYWGIGEGEEMSYGDQGVNGDYRKAGWSQLIQFGYDREILKREGEKAEPGGDDAATEQAAAAGVAEGAEPAADVDDAAGVSEPEGDESQGRHLEAVPEAAFSGS